MVDAGLARSRSGLGMDYRSTDDLFRSWLYVAEPGTDRAGSIAGNGNRTRMASLEGWNFTIKLCPRGIKLPRSRQQCQLIFRKVAKSSPIFQCPLLFGTAVHEREDAVRT